MWTNKKTLARTIIVSKKSPCILHSVDFISYKWTAILAVALNLELFITDLFAKIKYLLQELLSSLILLVQRIAEHPDPFFHPSSSARLHLSISVDLTEMVSKTFLFFFLLVISSAFASPFHCPCQFIPASANKVPKCAAPCEILHALDVDTEEVGKTCCHASRMKVAARPSMDLSQKVSKSLQLPASKKSVIPNIPRSANRLAIKSLSPSSKAHGYIICVCHGRYCDCLIVIFH